MLPNEPFIPHIEQYTSSPWAITEREFNALREFMTGRDMLAHVRDFQAKVKTVEPGNAAPYELEDGIATVDLRGTMTKYGSSFSSYHGSVRLRRTIRHLAASDEVSAIMLRIDSGGGSVMGTGDLADEVHEAAKKKWITAYIEDIGASAAYYVASQASKVIAGPNASVGSIGVYTVLADWSGLYAREGVKVHVVRAGKFKGMGTQGTEVTAEQLMELQREVDDINAQFVKAVARGRRITPEAAMELADGRIHQAEQARELGLVDAVRTFDAAMSDLRGKVQTKLKTGARASATGAIQETVMADETKDVKPVAEALKAATLGEIEAAIPDASAESKIAWLKAGHTLSACKDAHMDVLRAQTKVATAEAEKAAAKPKPGVDAVNDVGSGRADGGGNATQRWNERLAEMQKVFPGDPAKAVAALRKADPLLHEDYVAEFNAERGRKVA